ncbi:MAG: ornithine cyclodeaminase family protein [Clostridia bacterium]|nr:ornithine cyclodeaminase family protein [Clostridia bacterium]
MLYLTREEMQAVCPMGDAFTALEEAFTLYVKGEADVPLRVGIDVPAHNGQALFMPARAGDALGIKIVSTYPDNPKAGLPVTPATMLVIDSATGIVSAMMDGTYLTSLRTAAGAGVATRLLAPEGATVGALIGLGGQGPCQFDALVEAVPTLKEIRVYDMDAARREAFAKERDGKHGIAVIPVDSGDEAVRGAQVVTTVTTARAPVFSYEAVTAPCHINAIGSYTPEMQELPPELVANCDLLALDTADGVLNESGDILKPLKAGLLEGKKIDTEIGTLLLERHKRGAGDITVYKSTGSGVMDTVSATFIVEKALEKGLGTQIG